MTFTRSTAEYHGDFLTDYNSDNFSVAIRDFPCEERESVILRDPPCEKKNRGHQCDKKNVN